MIWAVAVPARALELETADLIERLISAWIEADWPATSTDPNVCRHCGRRDRSERLIPIGVSRHVWVHWECSDVWRTALHREARARWELTTNDGLQGETHMNDEPISQGDDQPRNQ